MTGIRLVCNSTGRRNCGVYEKAKVCVVNADDALTMPVRGADELRQLWRQYG